MINGRQILCFRPTRWERLVQLLEITQHYAMLQRNLEYTGITRGKQLVVLVGHKKALGMAIKNHLGRRRFTKLGVWLGEWTISKTTLRHPLAITLRQGWRGENELERTVAASTGVGSGSRVASHEAENADPFEVGFLPGDSAPRDPPTDIRTP